MSNKNMPKPKPKPTNKPYVSRAPKAEPIADYSDPSKRKFRFTEQDDKNTLRLGYGTQAESDANTVYDGLMARTGKSKNNKQTKEGEAYYFKKGAGGYAADAAYQNSWIARAAKASALERMKARKSK